MKFLFHAVVSPRSGCRRVRSGQERGRYPSPYHDRPRRPSRLTGHQAAPPFLLYENLNTIQYFTESLAVLLAVLGHSSGNSNSSAWRKSWLYGFPHLRSTTFTTSTEFFSIDSSLRLLRFCYPCLTDLRFRRTIHPLKSGLSLQPSIIT